MPSPEPDPWAYERHALARRRRRRRRQQRMLWLLTGVTTAVLLVIAWMISEIAPVPTTASPAALSASARASAGVSAGASAGAAIPGVGRSTGTARPRASPKASPGASYPRVTDYSSGLSYRLFGSPWRRGCPSVLQTPMFSWSAGENAVAGNVVIGGGSIQWHGNACSGQLQQQFAYTGPGDLQATAMSLVDALEPAYYAGIRHYLMVQDSSTMQVGGDQAWAVRFTVSYYPDTGQGVTWSSELGAVVVVDRGPDHVPALFYVSVPDKFNTTDVNTLIRSLRVAS